VFFLLRAALVIGAIAWLSPVRDTSPPADRPFDASDLANADRLWQALPEPLRQELLARLRERLAKSAPGPTGSP
jgi:hypothetical protein